MLCTVMKSGESLEPEFVAALKNQTLQLPLYVFASINDDEPKRENMYRNWVNAFYAFLKTGDSYLIGIDSDVILTEKTALKDLVQGLDKYDLTAIATHQNQLERDCKGITTAHSLFAAKHDVIEKVEYKKVYRKTGGMACPNCHWCYDVLDSGYRVGFATGYTLKEVQR